MADAFIQAVIANDCDAFVPSMPEDGIETLLAICCLDRLLPPHALGDACAGPVQFERSALDPSVLVFRVCDLSWVVDTGWNRFSAGGHTFLERSSLCCDRIHVFVR